VSITIRTVLRGLLVRSRHPKEYGNNGAALQALSQMHYDGSMDVYSGTTFSLNLVRALVSIGVFLLLIACINFINLATAQAVNRAREVGVRRVLGASVANIVTLLSKEFTILVLIAWVTVGYRAVRAALANPAGALKAE
jgi:hypothetical protein